jgi:hypothetical protein
MNLYLGRYLSILACLLILATCKSGNTGAGTAGPNGIYYIKGTDSFLRIWDYRDSNYMQEVSFTGWRYTPGPETPLEQFEPVEEVDSGTGNYMVNGTPYNLVPLDLPTLFIQNYYTWPEPVASRWYVYKYNDFHPDLGVPTAAVDFIEKDDDSPLKNEIPDPKQVFALFGKYRLVKAYGKSYRDEDAKLADLPALSAEAALKTFPSRDGMLVINGRDFPFKENNASLLGDMHIDPDKFTSYGGTLYYTASYSAPGYGDYLHLVVVFDGSTMFVLKEGLNYDSDHYLYQYVFENTE